MKIPENTETPGESLQTHPNMLDVTRNSENHVFRIFGWVLASVEGPLGSLRRAPESVPEQHEQVCGSPRTYNFDWT